MVKTNINLVPNIQNPSPDYYCTWQTQLYASCDGKPEGQRAIIGEKAMFSNEKPFGWAYFYEDARKDLFFVMDDSWDVPTGMNHKPDFGTLQLDKEKFPESTQHSSNEEALRSLSERVKSFGWKGLGGWVCAQESPLCADNNSPEKYWIKRLKEAHYAGFSYWKVDWGAKKHDIEFRKMLTKLGKEYAPELIVEHSMLKELIPCSDVYRTYDVPAIMSIPLTMEKLKKFGNANKTDNGYMGLINCEDEAYIAAAAGYAMGIMRHPYSGDFVNGKSDMSFPSVHRNLKTKITEITRAVRWHRIAPAFGEYGAPFYTDEKELTDFWTLKNRHAEFEEWWYEEPYFKQFINGNVIKKSAPARISRGCPLPDATPDNDGNVPYIVSAKNPNGAFSIATLGRTLDRKYYIPACDITAYTYDSDTVGVFGEYNTLTLQTNKQTVNSVFMQDLAGNLAYDITCDVTINQNSITIPGKLIKKIGTEAQPKNDTSEPGVIVYLK